MRYKTISCQLQNASQTHTHTTAHTLTYTIYPTPAAASSSSRTLFFIAPAARVAHVVGVWETHLSRHFRSDGPTAVAFAAFQNAHAFAVEK